MIAKISTARSRAPQFLWPGVCGCSSRPFSETLFVARHRIAHDARQQPHDRVEQNQRRRLAAGQDIVADRNLLQGTRLDHPLVDAFEAAADDQCTRPNRQLAHLGLRQRPSARAHQQPWPRIAGRRGVVDRLGQNIGAHHHAGAAAGRRVVDGAVAVGGEIADLDRLQRPRSGFERPAGQRQAKRAGNCGKASARWRGNSPVASGIARSTRAALWVEAGSADRNIRLAVAVCIAGKTGGDAVDPKCPRGKIDHRHRGFGERHQRAVQPRSGDFQYVASAEILHGGDLADLGAVLIDDRQPDKVGVIKLLFVEIAGEGRRSTNSSVRSAPRRAAICQRPSATVPWLMSEAPKRRPSLTSGRP